MAAGLAIYPVPLHNYGITVKPIGLQRDDRVSRRGSPSTVIVIFGVSAGLFPRRPRRFENSRDARSLDVSTRSIKLPIDGSGRAGAISPPDLCTSSAVSFLGEACPRLFPRPVASFRRFETVIRGHGRENRCTPELSRGTLKPRNANPPAWVIESDASDLRAKQAEDHVPVTTIDRSGPVVPRKSQPRDGR